MEPIKSILRSHNLENVFIIETRDRRMRPLTHSPSCPLLFLDLEAVQANEQHESPVRSDESQNPQCRASSKQEIIDLFAEQIEIISQDDIFLDSLYLLPGESAIINSWLSRRIEGKPFVNGNPVTPLLPFRERIREFFSSDELSRQCLLSLKSTRGGMELTLTLKLPIEGHQDPYHVRRTYPIKESNLIDEDLPVIAL